MSAASEVSGDDAHLDASQWHDDPGLEITSQLRRASVLLTGGQGLLSLMLPGEHIGEQGGWSHALPGAVVESGVTPMEAAQAGFERCCGFPLYQHMHPLHGCLEPIDDFIGAEAPAGAQAKGITDHALWSSISTSDAEAGLVAAGRVKGRDWRWVPLSSLDESLHGPRCPALSKWSPADRRAISALIRFLKNPEDAPESDRDSVGRGSDSTRAYEGEGLQGGSPSVRSVGDLNTSEAGEPDMGEGHLKGGGSTGYQAPVFVAPVIHPASPKPGQTCKVGKVVMCKRPGMCGDCGYPLTLGHLITCRPVGPETVMGDREERWCHLVCQLQHTPPRSQVPPPPVQPPREPPKEYDMPAASAFEPGMVWVNLHFGDTIGDWMAPSRLLSQHRLVTTLYKHYGASAHWECAGEVLSLAHSTACELQLQQTIDGATTGSAVARSLQVFGVSLPSDGLWVKDWMGLHGSDEFIGHRVCTEAAAAVGTEFSEPLISRRLVWKEKYQEGGVRMDTAMRCWEAVDCGGKLSRVRGAFKCTSCKSRAHYQCLGVAEPMEEEVEVVCPTCRALKATPTPSVAYVDQMSQLTLVEAGASVANHRVKARKAVARAMKVYEERFELPAEACLVIPDSGSAFLRSVGAEGKSAQMSKHKAAISIWLVERGLHDWTTDVLCMAATKEPARAMAQAPKHSDTVYRAHLKKGHELLMEDVGRGLKSPLLATRTDLGQHQALGIGGRAGDTAGTDTAHGPHCAHFLLAVEEEMVGITPNAEGDTATPGATVQVMVPWSATILDDHKTALRMARIPVAGATLQRRAKELASAWGRDWKKVEVKGVQYEHMDYYVLRVSLLGVVEGTPQGDAMLRALDQAQEHHNPVSRFRTQTMLTWLKKCASSRAGHSNPDFRWVNVMDGTEAEVKAATPRFMRELQRLYKVELAVEYQKSEGLHGSMNGGAPIGYEARWGPVLCTTAGKPGGKYRVPTPMPLDVQSFERDVTALWARASEALGMSDSKPTSHGGRRGACELARRFANQSGIHPTDMRERVNHFFRWTPEKDRMQIYYSDHLPDSEQLKMTVLFWLKGGEYDY